ncbi:acetolactate synthase large subunit [Paracoccus onubensis]|uniref:Acetolactate synthase large subunit n=1 Tax=Paracoccus onubensis TaxID=1675788 RepID=A0A418T810_9RHOB|nr:acetolactate synthase large subunit [Paracoccus onubensis]RJE89342.1 acetolactate synthase large subunit [Paracoccus onubensis]
MKNDENLSGAEALVHSLVAGNVDTCFANPGTSEMHFVAALDRIPGIRCVLGLQENTVTGMADGYFRVARRPAATLLHCGPGYANGIANIHNGRRAGSGMLNIVGDHATDHVAHDSPLTANVEALVGSTSNWLRFGVSPGKIGEDAMDGLRAAAEGYGQIASLVLPADVSWSKGGAAAVGGAPPAGPGPHDPAAVTRVAAALQSGRKALILLGTPAVVADLHPLLLGISETTGADLMGSPAISSQPRGRGRLDLPAVPYPVSDALRVLEPYDLVVLVNCPAPVGFFRYPGLPSLLHREDAEILTLTDRQQDARSALNALAETLNAAPRPVQVTPERIEKPQAGPITPDSLAAVVAGQLPENCIVVNEALTSGGGFGAVMGKAAPCDWMTVTGGAIGGGIPLATGAAIGAEASGQKGRRVITLQADGSAAYTVQALWTQARENLPVTTLLLNNRSYAILLGEYAKVGASPGPTANDMMSLSRPDIDWVAIAQGFGVEALSVADNLELDAAFGRALTKDGPMLIDIRL